MKTSRQLKAAARQNLIGNYGKAMVAFVILILLSAIVELPFSHLVNGASISASNYVIYYIAEFLIAILAGVLQIGLLQLHLSFARRKTCRVSDMFCCYKSHTDRYILGFLLVFIVSMIGVSPALYVYFFCELTLAGLPFILGMGFISLLLSVFFNILLSQVFYVMLDNDDMTIMQCYKKALELIKGNKGRLLYIYMSFIGMWILVILSFGIGYLWVEPYMVQTYTVFYLDLIGEAPVEAEPAAESVIDVNITD